LNSSRAASSGEFKFKEQAKEFALAFNVDRVRQLNIRIPEDIVAAVDAIFSGN
jgi:hypothetical protein